MKLQVFVYILLVVKCHYGYHHHQNSWNPGYYYYNHHKIPQDVMVDAVNNLALKLLAIHNENNDNNIAISPYGALTVLVALGEGLRGEAAHEIQWAANIPSDISVIRVGLRDIHRHLKSYFIPDEGFLSGLTLSHDNVTLHREYQSILKFYGFDINSFNSALYPEIATTQKTEISSAIPTTESNGREEETTTVATDVSSSSTLRPEVITETDRLIRSEPTTLLVDDVMTTTTEKAENLPESSTIMSTTLAVPTTTEESTTVIPTRVTTSTLPPEITSTETSRTEVPTRVTTTTLSLEITSAETSTTTEVPTRATTTNLPPEISSTETSTTEVSTIVEEYKEKTSSTSSKTTRSVPESTTFLSTIQETSTEIKSEGTSTLQQEENSKTTRSVPEATTFFSTIQEISSTEEMSTIQEENTKTTTLENDLTSTTTESLTSTSITTESSSEQENVSTEETTSTTESSSTEVPTTTDSDRLELESTTINNLNMPDSNNEILRRNTRSVVDYIIARYYDDHSITQRPPPPTRIENGQNNNNGGGGGLNFLVNGKYRQSNISYMTYDTVLPFHYSQQLHSLALRFPLDSNKYYLLLLLPEHEANIDQVICNLRLNTDLKHIINNLKFTRVRAEIPSFMLKGYVVLTSTFQKMGVKKVFEPRQADFSPMTEDKDIYVTNIEQAITVTIRNYMDPSKMNDHRYLYDSEPVYFKADHPFLYFVIDSEIDIVLMAGKISNPLNSRIR